MISQLKERYFALDGLRAVMMLLGVVLHSAITYATYPFGVVNGLHDVEHTYALTVVVFFIHLFRMPLFFLVAGFFGSLLWQKYGLRALLRNRVKRVLFPLIGSWVFLFPLTIVGAAFTMLGGPKGIATISTQLNNGPLMRQNNTSFGELFTQLGLVHLWFLYFLMLFYVGMALLLTGVQRLPVSAKAFVRNKLQKVAYQPVGILLLGGLTWLALFLMPAANLQTTGLENSNALLPPLRLLAAYFIFFAFGWGLFRRQEMLAVFQRRAGQFTGLGSAAAGLYAGLILHPYFAPSHLLQTAAAAAAIWLLSLGILGLALRYAGKPNAVSLYLSNASYWVYLVHLPLTLLLPGFLLNVSLPALVKFLIVCTGTAALSLLSYQWFVRSTRLGRFINGRQLTPYRFFSRLRKGHQNGVSKPLAAGTPAPEKQQVPLD